MVDIVTDTTSCITADSAASEIVGIIINEFLQNAQKIFIPFRKKNNRNKKTFPIKMKEHVGMSKHKKHANKIRWDPKLNKSLPYNTTQVQHFVCTYMELYRSGCLIFGPTYSCLNAFWVLTLLHVISFLLKMFYYYYYFSDSSFFCLLNYHNDSSTIPVAFIVKFWSTEYCDDILRYYEKRESQ